MATNKTLHGPVTPIGDKHYDMVMDGTGRLCDMGDGRLHPGDVTMRLVATRAGIWTEPDGKGGLFCAAPSADGCSWVPLEPCDIYRTPCEGLDVLRANYKDAKAKLGAAANPPTHRRNRAVADNLAVRVGSLLIDSQNRVCAANGSVLMDTPDNRSVAHREGLRGMGSSVAGDGILRAGWVEATTEFDGSEATLSVGTMLDERAPVSSAVWSDPVVPIGEALAKYEAHIDTEGLHALAVDEFRREMSVVLGGIPSESLDKLRAMLPSVLASGGERTDIMTGLPVGALQVASQMGLTPADIVTGDGASPNPWAAIEAACGPVFNGPQDLGANPGRAFTLGRDQRRVGAAMRRIIADGIAGQDTPEGRHQAQLRMIQQGMALSSRKLASHKHATDGDINMVTNSPTPEALTASVVEAARASLLPTNKAAAVGVAGAALAKAYGFDLKDAQSAVAGAAMVLAGPPSDDHVPTLETVRSAWCGKPEPNRDDYDRGLMAADGVVSMLRHKQQRTAELLADELVAGEYGDAARGMAALGLLERIREDLAIPDGMSTRMYLRWLGNSRNDALVVLCECWSGMGMSDVRNDELRASIHRVLNDKAKP